MEEAKQFPKIRKKQLFFQIRYLVLNEKTFSVFKNENIESLIFSIEAKIIKFTRKDEYLGVFCLKIEEKAGNGGVFCSEDSRIIGEWESFLVGMKNCSTTNVTQIYSLVFNFI